MKDIDSNNTQRQDTSYDAVIVGGGLIGFAFALLFHQRGLKQQAAGKRPWRLLIVDQKGAPSVTKTKHSPPFPSRVSAINQQQLKTLIDAGLDANSLRGEPVRKMQVWEKESTAFFTLDSHDIGLETMASVIENDSLVHELYHAVKKSPFVDMTFETQLSGYQVSSHGQPRVTLSDGSLIKTQLLIGSDGQHSSVRRMAGIEASPNMASEIAIIAQFETEHSHGNTARQMFLGDSILAFLPIEHPMDPRRGNAISIVWSGKRNALESIASDQFTEMATLVEKYGNSLDPLAFGKMTLSSHASIIPLNPQCAEQVIKPGIILIGDAAHTLHPLAGQGANLGLSDCEALVAHLDRAWHRGIPLGNHTWNRRYARARQAETATMTRAIRGIQRIYAHQNHWSINLARQFGVQLFKDLKPMHQWTMRKMQQLGNGF